TASNPAAGGTVAGSGFVTANSNATLTATAASGYRLVDWSGAGSPAPTTSSINVNVTCPLTVTANFSPAISGQPNTYLVTLVANTAAAVGTTPINNFGQVVGFSTLAAH